MLDRRGTLRLLSVTTLASLGFLIGCNSGSASETKLHRYVIGVSGMT